MAHYAFLDSNNIVTEVIVGKDESDTQHDWEFTTVILETKLAKEHLIIQVVELI